MKYALVGTIVLGVLSFVVPVSDAHAASVDLKVNGSDGPVTVPTSTLMTASWTVAGASEVSECISSSDPREATVGWHGYNRALPSGSTELTSSSSPLTYTLSVTCYLYSSPTPAVDSVTINSGMSGGGGGSGGIGDGGGGGGDGVFADLKVYGSDGPVSIPAGSNVLVSWTAPGSSQCWASSSSELPSWSGSRPTFGSLVSVGPITSSMTLHILCSGGVRDVRDLVVVNVESTNRPPVAVAKVSTGGGPYSSEVWVTRGVPVNLLLGADESTDPDGWTTAGVGVSQGGKCEWNSDLNQGTTTYEVRQDNPPNPAWCSVLLSNITFNDLPGRYIYPVLRITDAAGGVSNIASITVVVLAPGDDEPTPTPSPTASVSPVPSPSCDPFGYNSDCSTPVPSPSITPTVLPSPSPTVTPVVIGSIIDPIQDILHGAVSAITDRIAKITGIDAATIARFIKEKAKSLANALAAAALALSLPLIVTNVLPQLGQWGRFFGSFFAAKRQKDRWGIVVDSDLGKPIAGAAVQVFDAKFHQLKETQITGPDGQFGFLLLPGQYSVIANREGFVFPARKRPPTVLRENERIYLGEEFAISDQDPEKIPRIVVPMDREVAAFAGKAIFARLFQSFLAFVDRVGFVFLFVGAALNTFLLLLFPGTLNILFEVLYLILFAFKLYILLSHEEGIGTVSDTETGAQIDLAIIRLYDAASNRIVQTRVTNKNGKFFLLVPRGSYTASVSKQGYETLTMSDISIKKKGSQAISLDFALRKIG